MNDFAKQLPQEWEPHGYQLSGIKWLVTHPEGALFWPPGLGKTTVTLATFLRLRELGYKHRMLVLAPLRVCQTTWMSEPKKWLQFVGLKIGLAHGKDKEKVLQDPNLDIVIMNYDGINWAAPLLTKANSFQILVFDELTKVKHTNTKRFKTLKPLLPLFQFRWGLTGTPVSNGLLDLFGQIYCLDLGARFGKYVTHFRLGYFTQSPFNEWLWEVQKAKLPAIYNKLADIAYYLRAEDYLELPDLLHILIPVELPAPQRVKYKQFETTYLLDERLTAANAGVLSMKLRQFLGGAVLDEGVVYEQHNAKLEALDDLIEEMAGEPLLVAYAFNHELERILARHPTALYIRGGMSKHQVEDTVTKWNAGAAPILLVQPQAAAHGLNLQFGGSALCWFTLTYSLEDYIQLIARLYRQGQKNTVRNYILTVEKSMDVEVARALSAKDATQESVFQALMKKS